ITATSALRALPLRLFPVWLPIRSGSARSADVAVIGPADMEDRRRTIRGLAGVPGPATVFERDEALTVDVDVVADEREAATRENWQVGSIELELLAHSI